MFISALGLKAENWKTNKIYFKFSVWEYEDIVTEVVVINKPSGGTMIPTSMPMILTRETAPMDVNTGKNR